MTDPGRPPSTGVRIIRPADLGAAHAVLTGVRNAIGDTFDTDEDYCWRLVMAKLDALRDTGGLRVGRDGKEIVPTRAEVKRRMCECHKDCRSCSRTGTWHQHRPNECPQHPDAPVTGTG